jgi:two-component system cell cycle sensor histidine kinase/response regulator CckA
MTPRDKASPDRSAGPGVPPTPEIIRVLLVAANPVDEIAITQLLRAGDDGLQITGAPGITDALRLYGPAAYDVMLVDLALSAGENAHVVRTILDARPDAVVVVLTDDRSGAAGEAAVRLGAQDYVAKNAMTGGALRRVVRYARARKAARSESEDRYRRIIQGAHDAVVCTDAHGIINDWNPRAEALFGWTREEVIGRSITDTIISSRRAGALHHELATLCPAMRALTEAPMRRKDGTTVPVELTVSTVGDGNARIHTAFIRDATERRRAEERLRSEKAFTDDLIDSMPGAFALIDASGRIMRWNAHLSRILLKEPGDTHERFLVQYIWPEDRNRAAAKVAEAFREGQATVEVRLQRADGVAVPFLATAVRILHDGAPCLIATGVDLSERRAIEAQLAHAQKLESVGRLAGAVAHDFNNMLAAVLAFAELLLMDSAPDDPRRADIQTIHDAANGATGLTRQLLAFSRRQVFTPKILELNAIVTGLDRMLRRLIGEDVELVTVLGDDVGLVEVDPGQMESALMNLAVNARDAMPEGGTLTLHTSTVDLPGGRFSRLTVTDTGTGMSEDVLQHVYEPFFTTKEPGKGTGLGLASVYRIVRQSGGNITVASRQGEGTSFTIDLPQLASATPDATAGAQARAVGGTETILLAEDNDLVRHGVAATMGARGYTVLQALNGQEAVRIAARHPGPIHLVLSDVVMPKMAAPEMIAKLRQLRPDTAILLMSGFVSDAVLAELGSTAFIQKPFTSEALAQMVRSVLDGAAAVPG